MVGRKIMSKLQAIRFFLTIPLILIPFILFMIALIILKINYLALCVIALMVGGEKPTKERYKEMVQSILVK